MRCKKCNKKITGSDAGFFDKSGVCMQCCMEDQLEVVCEVCGKVCSITEVALFMRHYICEDCRVEDLLENVKVVCVKCGVEVKLLNACEFSGKHACRECGIKMLTHGNAPVQKEEKTGSISRT